MKYNREIHMKAKKHLALMKQEVAYEKDCVKAGICAGCGEDLIYEEDKPNPKDGSIDTLVKCKPCDYVYDIILGS